VGAWTTKRTICPQCGRRCYPYSKHHKGSVYHKHHAEIAARLADVRNTFAAVADEYGLSRERVRQFAEELGLHTGRKICTLRREARLADEFDRAFPDKKFLQDLGLRVERFLGQAGQLSTRFLKLNGHVCLMGRAWPTSIHGGGYVRLSRYTGPSDGFVLYRLPLIDQRQHWMVVPAAAAPTYTGLFALVLRGPSPRFSRSGPPESYKGKWLQYIDAWHLLKE